VIDDCSTDGSAEIAEGYAPSVKYIFQPHSGIAAARNKGVRSARGEFLAFLDADDIWDKDKLKLQVKSLQNDTQLDMVFGHMRQFISPDLSAAEQVKLMMPQEVMAGYSAGAMLITRSAFDRVGFFDEGLRAGEFIDWYSRVAEKGLKARVLEQVVLLRRLHLSNMGRTQKSSRADYLKLVKDAIGRRGEPNV
jgi:glycosyltransferase involved in cell wall biosynthesis